ncbi:unnamed protein product [Adineta ricciae]|uniref:Uncharacterized protein n=1 Tax=Adineta ricciae TaxID=249248 RepID=A0A815XBS2_ADIRI|nr:unnamed protein product [Adineta ricciae]
MCFVSILSVFQPIELSSKQWIFITISQCRIKVRFCFDKKLIGDRSPQVIQELTNLEVYSSMADPYLIVSEHVLSSLLTVACVPVTLADIYKYPMDVFQKS